MLRAERDNLKAVLQRSLGHQADQLANAGLVERINELTALAHQLTTERDQARRDKATLEQQLKDTEDDLAAARTSLQRMIRANNTTERGDPSNSGLSVGLPVPLRQDRPQHYHRRESG